MNSRPTRSNALLMELLIVVFFFLVAAGVILNLFLAVSDQAQGARRLSLAAQIAQTAAQKIAANEDATEALDGYSVASDGKYRKTDQGLDIVIQTINENMESGVMRGADIEVYYKDTCLYAIPVRRYWPGEGGAAS